MLNMLWGIIFMGEKRNKDGMFVSIFRWFRGCIVASARTFLRTWRVREIWGNPFSVYWFFAMALFGRMRAICRFRFKGIPFYTRLLDWNAVDEVILRGEYREVVAVLLGNQEQPVVLDLGANIGTFSVQVFACNRSAVVHAVEPSLETYQILQKSRGVNPSLDWHIHRYALWCENGVISFEENLQASTGSHLGQSGQAVLVPAIRLATLVEEHVSGAIDLVKMDIEGAEEAVLMDSVDVMRGVQGLILEIHPYRCDEMKIRRLLHREFPFVYEITGRESKKPLLVASRQQLTLTHAVQAELPVAIPDR